MGGEMITLIKVLLIFMVSLFYCHSIASKLPKGKLRLLSLLPVLYLFATLPLYLSSILLLGTLSFFNWITMYKLVSFAFDSGPLISNPPLSFPLFASIAFFPARIRKHNKNKSNGGDHHSKDQEEAPPKLPLNLPAKAVILAILIMSINNNNSEEVELLRHPITKLYINIGLLYFYLDIIMSLSNTLVESIFGVKVKQQFDEPYLATSLQNFWSRRWNILISKIFHNTIYKPIRNKARRPRWVAVIAVFVVSGMMHEFWYFYISRMAPTWGVVSYFLIHGLCVAIEIELKRVLGKKWQLHPTVSIPLTMAFFGNHLALVVVSTLIIEDPQP